MLQIRRKRIVIQLMDCAAFKFWMSCLYQWNLPFKITLSVIAGVAWKLGIVPGKSYATL